MKLRYPNSSELILIDANDSRQGPSVQLLCWGCAHFKTEQRGSVLDGAACCHGGMTRPMRDAKVLQECPFLGKPVDLSNG